MKVQTELFSSIASRILHQTAMSFSGHQEVNSLLLMFYEFF
uniref:Uncharacterized protein n=3 Tax=Vibrio cholerae TaxID=666 RepID=C9E585_VIBCL|nr:hypothetical protein ICEVCHBAN5_0040 [Vibrio cholerae Ban5]ACV96395.1 hypothetical protein ICEVCHIND5_0036 [Vibrio cholerae Ind5]AQY15811.1 hypothetical protein [Vibrio cholerae O1 biovar El Tor str. Inaba RND18826]WKK29815.1 hypothetical protein [Vibrio cholerae O1]